MYLMAHPDGYVLFDCGLPDEHLVGNSAFTMEGVEYGIAADHNCSVGRFLDAFGVTTGDLYCEVVSHLHFDHAGGLPDLPGVQIILQEDELVSARQSQESDELWIRPAIDDAASQTVALRGDHDIFGDESLVILATPGHTPGHQCLYVRLKSGEQFILGGDLVYYPYEFRDRRIPPVAWSREESLESVARISKLLESSGAKLLLSHDPDYESVVRLAPAEFYGALAKS
jgi:glyoxylase-like metal-dependent hydrolase (beta-lactamase superfamily II)